MAETFKRSRNIEESSSNWAELYCDVLEHIFQFLSFKDVLIVEGVCRPWFSAAKAFIKSRFQSCQLVPWLLLPPDDGRATSEYCILNMETKNVSKLKNIYNEMSNGCCIGSSHGWLIFLDESVAPLLLNPFLQVKIKLPRLNSLMGILEIARNDIYWEYCIYYYDKKRKFSVSYAMNLRENVIHKAVLHLHDSCFSIKGFTIIVIYGVNAKLAYCKTGENSCWMDLEAKHQPYHEILCTNSQLYALSSNSIEVWDFDDGTPIKRMDLELTNFPEKSSKFFWLGDRELYATKFYLAEIHGEVMLMVRLIGEYVNGDDEAIREEDLLIEDDTHPLVCPYKTLLFHVYKLDLAERNWVEVDSLGDYAVFLGGNNSVTVSTQFYKNSIFFTDDYWSRMNEDYLYGGHDIGIFHLEDYSVEPIYPYGSEKIQPPPCWVNPSPWSAV
ncbi:putative F-box protein At4g22180 [Mangifera indica]|uniref:putative F-box protein At4g22180 n=1 Tax=Mangifera indica TaxID=29780 RepID=UPI001CFAAFD7|nr:putative F-box protein At4g22180 [Mangifera indica]